MAQLRYLPIIGITLIAAAILPVQAEDTLIYKWVDKNGVVSFSQSKPTDPEAHDISKITINTLPAPQKQAANRMLMNLEDPQNSDFDERQQRMKQADEDVDQALQQLQKAEQNYKEESIPTGYDRVGNVNGRARLRDSYFERVEKLQMDVDQARQELNGAYHAREQLYPM